MSEAAAHGGLTRLLSDDRLTRRAVAGDERAFATIFRRYHQPLYRFCLAIVGNPEDAQDALQNAMMKVLRALPGEERQIELKPWLYRIAHNESIDLLRRRRETRELDAEQAAPGYGLAEDAATRERLRGLIADLKELPERQRQVLVMRELAGFDFEEIGTALDTSGAVARQTLYEARQSLRQMNEGREMSCETVTQALSDGDGRVTRRRDVRAHLRSCARCQSFRDEIQSRQRALAALSPLPAVAAAGMLQGLLGGSQAAAGGGLAALVGGGTAQSIGVSAAAKGAATVAVAAAIGVTAADRSGVIHLGVPGGNGAAQSSEPAPGSPAAGSGGNGAGSLQDSVRVGGGGKAGGAGKAESRAGSDGGPSPQVSQGQGAGIAPSAGAKAQPPVAHPHGRDHEKQHPAAAGHGQETAAEHKPPAPEGGAGGVGEAPAIAPPKPSPPPQAPPKEPPVTSGPPATSPQPAPELPEQASEYAAPAPPPASEAPAEKRPADPGKSKAP
jgi:RNA polymerase sigma factor (sigma-70 family)